VNCGSGTAPWREPLNAVVCSRVRELQEALRPPRSRSRSVPATPGSPRSKSAGTGRDLILDKRPADMADLPGGASGMLCRDYKGKEADRLVTRIAPGVVSLVPNCAATSGRPPRNSSSGRTASRSNARRLAGRHHSPCC
jgi:hypothetical protein